MLNNTLKEKTILVTGSPGFIGANLVESLIKAGAGFVISFDNLNSYYDPALKKYRLQKINVLANSMRIRHTFIEGDIQDCKLLNFVFDTYKPDIAIHMAAQAGVRYSITNPGVYIDANIRGFFNVLDMCRLYNVEHLIYASSSSVYGNANKIPFSTEDMTDHPESLYAATKKSNELLAYTYSRIYGMKVTGLRFFTVYGPAGRPDMFYFSSALSMLHNEPIKLFNYGNMERDFTYIDDIVNGIIRITSDESKQRELYKIYNIGKGKPDKISDMLNYIQVDLKEYGLINRDYNYLDNAKLMPMQKGDVYTTYADTSALEKDFGYKPEISLEDGIDRFATWFAEVCTQECMQKFHFL